jgi:hypothetical protein
VCILAGEIQYIYFVATLARRNVLKVHALDHHTHRVHVHRRHYRPHAVDMGGVE